MRSGRFLPVFLSGLLVLLFACAACSSRPTGDPVLNAWTEACGGTGRLDATGLPQFHDAIRDYADSPEFILMEQDIPELRDVIDEMLELSVSGRSDAGEEMGLLLLRYGQIASLYSDRSSHVIILILLLLSFFSFLLVVSMILFLRQQRKLSELRRKSEVERAVSAATIRMQEDERGRIYKELHDTVAQDSRSALFALQNLGRYLSDDPDARELYGRIEKLEGANIENVRSVIRNIIPPDLLGDFRTVLAEWAANVSHASPGGIDCRVSVREDADVNGLSPEQRLHIFRIMQEAVGNASRHSGADEISVLFRGGTLPSGGRSLVLVVSDDGRGFDPSALPAELADADASGGHFGIRGMRSRAEVMGGTFRVRSEPGGGCEVFVEVPLKWGGVTGSRLLTSRPGAEPRAASPVLRQLCRSGAISA